jgi:hypothetical protein
MTLAMLSIDIVLKKRQHERMNELLDEELNCSLCISDDLKQVYHEFVKDRRFFKCGNCDLIFVPVADHISNENEKNRYQKHQNSIADNGYRDFLMNVVTPICELVPFQDRNQLKILDYGSGPSPELGKILTEQGFNITNFDPYFCNDPNIFNNKWDLIVSVEVWEHFRNPKYEIHKIISLLKDYKFMVVMTQLHTQSAESDILDSFSNWSYPKDATHIAFYSEKTMRHIANIQSLDCKFLPNSVMILRKKSI